MISKEKLDKAFKLCEMLHLSKNLKDHFLLMFPRLQELFPESVLVSVKKGIDEFPYEKFMAEMAFVYASDMDDDVLDAATKFFSSDEGKRYQSKVEVLTDKFTEYPLGRIFVSVFVIFMGTR